MSFREMCSKASITRREILEYQNSRIEWLHDTLKVAEEVGLTVQQIYPSIGVYCYGTCCWRFKIETGCWSHRWRPHKQGKCHRITVFSNWKDDEGVVIQQIEKGEEGLAELRTAVQTWLADQVAKREIDRRIQQYKDLGYTPR